MIPQRKRARWRAAPRAPGCALDERRERVAVDLGRERRSGLGLGQPLRLPGEAEGAVAARLGAHLAEVADERVDLAAVVGDERDDARDPLDLGLLAAREALDEAREQLVPRVGLGEHA